jgi:hypothetical protein
MRNIAQTILSLLFCIGFALTAAAQDYDLVILNGRVMDPETKLDAVRNVGINHGIITAITKEALTGKETIDATGLVVAPGFIDTHWHGMDPYGFKLGLRDGLTTALELEAGAYPVEDFYNEFEGKTQVNYGASVSHIWARMAVLDHIDPKGLGLYGTALKDSMSDGARWNQKPYDPADQEALNAAVEQGLKQGGLGIGFPIGYYTIVGSPDVMSVASLARKYRTFITSHVRYLAQRPPSGFLGVEEMLTVAQMHRVPLLVHHVPSNCLGLTKQALDLIDQARAGGLNVVGEFYPYTFASSFPGADYLAPGYESRTGMQPSDIIEVATGQRQTKESFEKLRKENPTTTIVFYSMKEKDMMEALTRPGVFMGSDCMPMLPSGKDPVTWDSPYGYGKGHPRSSGSHARLLRLVRETKAISLMEALAKLSYYQAFFMEPMVPDMKMRGRIQKGAVADITIFDAEKVTDQADWKPGMNSLPSTGIPYVVVNGTIVVKDSQVLKGVNPGQPIRNKILD